MSVMNVARVEVAHLLQANLSKLARVSFEGTTEQGTDVRVMLQVMAGVLTETAFFFEQPDETLEATLNKISVMLGCRSVRG